MDDNADPSRFSTTIAPKFCIGAHSAIAHSPMWNQPPSPQRSRPREFENLANPT
jgi:hypothetical protein